MPATATPPTTTTRRRPPNVAEAVAALDPAWTPPGDDGAGQGKDVAALTRDRIAEADILDAVQAGRFVVDVEAGEVITAAGRQLVVFSNRTDCRRFVRLHFDGRRRGIAVARLVWMARTGQLIPDGWEVHHRDENPGNDAWGNLICLHPDDHRKLHGQAADDEPIPF